MNTEKREPEFSQRETKEPKVTKKPEGKGEDVESKVEISGEMAIEMVKQIQEERERVEKRLPAAEKLFKFWLRQTDEKSSGNTDDLSHEIIVLKVAHHVLSDILSPIDKKTDRQSSIKPSRGLSKHYPVREEEKID